MKRSLRFLLTLLCVMLGVSSQAQISSVDELDNNKVYTLGTVRGYLPQTKDLTNIYGSLYIQSVTDAAKAGEFALINYKGNYYIYNTNLSEFLAANGTTTSPYTETPDGSFTVVPATEEGGNEGAFIIKSDVTGKWIMFGGSNQYLPADSWAKADDGDQWFITEVNDYDPTDAIKKIKEYLGETGMTLGELAATKISYDDPGMDVTVSLDNAKIPFFHESGTGFIEDATGAVMYGIDEEIPGVEQGKALTGTAKGSWANYGNGPILVITSFEGTSAEAEIAQGTIITDPYELTMPANFNRLVTIENSLLMPINNFGGEVTAAGYPVVDFFGMGFTAPEKIKSVTGLLIDATQFGFGGMAEGDDSEAVMWIVPRSSNDFVADEGGGEEEDPEAFGAVTADPADGSSVAELKEITLTYANAWADVQVQDGKSIQVLDADGNPVETVFPYIEMGKTIKIEEPLPSGKYTIVLPLIATNNWVDYVRNTITLSYEITGGAMTLGQLAATPVDPAGAGIEVTVGLSNAKITFFQQDMGIGFIEDATGAVMFTAEDVTGVEAGKALVGTAVGGWADYGTGPIFMIMGFDGISETTDVTTGTQITDSYELEMAANANRLVTIENSMMTPILNIDGQVTVAGTIVYPLFDDEMVIPAKIKQVTAILLDASKLMGMGGDPYYVLVPRSADDFVADEGGGGEEEDPEAFGEVKANPADGSTVTELSEITLAYANAWYDVQVQDGKSIQLLDADGNVVEGVYPYLEMGATVKIEEPIADGTYTLVLPLIATSDWVNYVRNTIRLNYTIASAGDEPLYTTTGKFTHDADWDSYGYDPLDFGEVTVQVFKGNRVVVKGFFGVAGYDFDATADEKNQIGAVNNGRTEGSWQYVATGIADPEEVKFWIPGGTTLLLNPEEGNCILKFTPSGSDALNMKYYRLEWAPQGTGINAAEATLGTDKAFNLQGQQLRRLQKGINIINGKKVVIK